MLVRDIRVNFAEFGDAVAYSLGPKPAASIFDISFECQFGPGKKAYGNTFFVGCGKTMRRRTSKVGRYEGFTDFGWARCNGMHAIVTHEILLPLFEIANPARYGRASIYRNFETWSEAGGSVSSEKHF